ncbi:MAG TPA: hypothetical protein VLG16_00890 [Candidatus Saccharimonadales bacterium]|nr:hypothetical protein [Candidatus Saccharimonadales bacterium]
MASSEHIAPKIQDFFNWYPGAKEIYGRTQLFHRTLGSNVPAILETGLSPQRRLFPEEHGDFVLRVCRKTSSDPNDSDYIRNRIIQSGSLYLMTEQALENTRYGIPERFMLLMRSLYTIANKQGFEQADRDTAQKAYDEHAAILTAPGQTIATLKVDPMAPNIVNTQLGNWNLDSLTSTEQAEMLVRHVRSINYYNIEIPGIIEPEYISEHNREMLTVEQAFLGIETEAGWARYVR